MAAHTSVSPHAAPATIASELSPFLDDLRLRRGLAAHTIASYRYDLLTASQVLTEPITAITTPQIEAFLRGRTERPSTTNRRIASLARFFIWAMTHDLCDRSPMVRVETTQETTRLPRPIRDDDLPALDTAIARTAAPYRLIFTLLRETGLRVAEVLQLNAGDVILTPGREGLHIHEAKNRVERFVVLTADVMPRRVRLLRRTLLASKPGAASLPLCCSHRGTRIPYDTLYYQWQRLCATANLLDSTGKPRYTIHQLRHTAATAFIRIYPEHIVSRMLGHRDPRSTRRYAAVTEDAVRAVLAERRR